VSNEAIVITLPDNTIQVVPSSPFEGDITVEVSLVVNETQVGAGTGDVVGPASAVNNRIAAFNGTTGKLIKDSGYSVQNVLDEAFTYALIF
jgi:hypothetical protein